MTEEKRREPRLNKVLGAEIEGSRLRLFVINLSRTGLRATCERPVGEGEEIQLALTLAAGDPPLVARARLAWRKELPASGTFDHGFELLDLDDAQGDRLDAFLQTELEKQRQPSTVDLKSPWSFGRSEPTYY